jgi:hypothetical protein
MDYKSKYLKYKTKYENLKKMQNTQNGGSYIMSNEDAENPSNFKNVDIFDTLPGVTVKKIFNNELPQEEVNKILVTAILTASNGCKNLGDELGPIIAPKYIDNNRKTTFKAQNPNLYKVIFGDEEEHKEP